MTAGRQIRLLCKGHKDFYNLQDVVRLFYGLSSIHEEADIPYLDIELIPNSKLAVLAHSNELRLESSYQVDNNEVKASLFLHDKAVLVKQSKVVMFNPNLMQIRNDIDKLSSPAKEIYLHKLEEQLIQSLLQPKRLVKKLLYDLLCEIEGLRFPWGSLTGIRPTYMATEIYHCLYNWRSLVSYALGAASNYELSDALKLAFSQASEANSCLTQELFNLLNSRLDFKCYQLSDLWQEVKVILEQLYDLSADKAELVARTAKNENQLLARALTTRSESRQSQPDKRLLSIYIGIPFCFTRCAYCSFAPRDGIKAKEDVVTAYVTALIKELNLLWPAIKGKIQTLYIGGGTPSALDAHNLERLMNCLTQLPMWEDIYEKTFEAGRADTITLEKLKLVKTAGFQHICVNPQSFKLETLKHIGRPAYADEIKDVMEMVRKLDFPVCNMDLIFGLPGENKQDMLYSLKQALSFAPENITIHTLAFKRKSWLGQLRQAERSVPMNIRSDLLLQDFANGLNQLQYVKSELHSTLTEGQNLLQARGYLPYYMYRQKDAVSALENTGFARLIPKLTKSTLTSALSSDLTAATSEKGYSLGNLYNVLMMLDQTSILGFGCCAMSKFVSDNQVERFSNARSVASYLENSHKHSLAKLELIKRYFV